MKKLEETLKKLEEGGFEEDILKREKGSRPRRGSGIPHKATKKEKGKILDEFEG